MKALFILLILFSMGLFAVFVIGYIPEYEYVGTIIDMEGGTSSFTLILELDTIGKTLYKTQKKCSNKIRIGDDVYWRTSFFGKSNYLWVKYAEGKYC